MFEKVIQKVLGYNGSQTQWIPANAVLNEPESSSQCPVFVLESYVSTHSTCGGVALSKIPLFAQEGIVRPPPFPVPFPILTSGLFCG